VPEARSEAGGGWRGVVLLAALSFGLAAIVRAPVLPLSVVDWDESLYQIIGHGVAQGRWPYQGVFDHKPVGLYALFALAELAFGHGTLAIRLLGILAVGTAAFFLGLFVRRAMACGLGVAAAVAGAYVMLSIANGGLATNTEILINAAFAPALWLAADPRMTQGTALRPSLAIGLLFGLMVQTNYLAAVLVVGFCLAYAVAAGAAAGVGGARTYLANGAWVFLGFLAATGLVLAPIAVWSDLGDYFQRQHHYLAGYHADPTAAQVQRAAADVGRVYGGLIALAAATLAALAWTGLQRRPGLLSRPVVAWQMASYGAVVTVACLASGRLFAHYFILLLPLLCAFAGVVLASLPKAGGVRLAGGLCLAFYSLGAAAQTPQLLDGAQAWSAVLAGRPADQPTRIARDLKPRLAPGETVYAYDFHTVVYTLLEVEPPTRFPFRDHHLFPREAAAAGVTPAAEMARIVGARPRFVIAGSDPHAGTYGEASRILADALDRDYRPVRTYGGKRPVQVFERR
jgi:hypothetical protein